MNGKAWVQDGRIRVRNPVEGGKPAVVAPGRGVRLFVNGEEVTQPRPVLEEDDLRIETLTERVPGETKVYLSPDGLEAFMEVKLDTIVSYDLADQAPRENLVLETTPRYKASCPYNYEQVVALLAEAGVRYGILREAVEAFLARPEDGRFLVARGKAPTPPVANSGIPSPSRSPRAALAGKVRKNHSFESLCAPKRPPDSSPRTMPSPARILGDPMTA